MKVAFLLVVILLSYVVVGNIELQSVQDVIAERSDVLSSIY